MKRCDTCGGPLADDHPFALCPKCLFGEAIHSHDASAGGAPEKFPLSPRRDFFEKYDILEKVAGGGQGEVWKTWDFEFHRCVAMKRIAEHASANLPAIHRFLAEAQIASQLEHPGILPIFDVGLDPDGRPFYTTQLLSGDTLETVWRQVHSAPGSPWTINRALELLLRVCEVMGHAHSRGVIHRDLKPANILVGAFGDVRVVDWGSAHVSADSLKNFEDAFAPLNSPAIETDRSRAMLGNPDSPLATASSGQPVTLLFTPPEIIAGNFAALGPVTDIYAVGVMLYQLLAGKAPYCLPDGKIPERDELKKAILEGPPSPVRAVNGRASRDLAAICGKAMAHDPAARYPAMTELAGDIRAALEIRPVQARRPGVCLKLQKWSQRNFSYVLLAGAALLLLSVAFSSAHGFKAQRDAARQSTLVRNAELAARGGRWREALGFWRAADAAGYRDKIYLGLQEAEAWTVLSEPEKSRAELVKLSRRSDLGPQRGAVLLRLGEHELFDRATATQGAQDIRAAQEAGLDAADTFFAAGLLADSTPEALDQFRRALQLNPYHHAAQLHALGLEFLLGRHADLAARIRIFKILYPEDFSPVFMEAAEQALAGNGTGALALLDSVRDQAGVNACVQAASALKTYAAAASFYDLDRWLSAENAATNAVSLLAPETVFSGGALPPGLRQPRLPCLQKGVLEGGDALARLAMPYLGSPQNSVAQIEMAWRHHPEALVSVMGGLILAARNPAGQSAPPELLRLQARLFQLGADSPSLLATLPRLARFLAARADFALANASPPDDSARTNCLAVVRQALTDMKSPAEFKLYSGYAVKLGEPDLDREIVSRWETQFPFDAAAHRSRVEAETVAGAFGSALELAERFLTEHPGDSLMLEKRKQILDDIKRLAVTAAAP